jgi:tripeptide aminopeptidase
MTFSIDRERLLQRFLQYVRIDTMSIEGAAQVPSSTGQLELGRLLADQLNQLGLQDVHQDEFGIVMATVPTTIGRSTPVIAWNAHLDTSPETSGHNVRPQVIRDYAGGDILLPGTTDQVIRVAEYPELQQLAGCTLITSDGTTLLGADDKAGIAIIIEAVTYLQEHRDISHGPLRVLFTCDEEIGHGVDHVDLVALGASVCYTLDGPAAGQIDVETFSADLATVTVRGINIHPSIGRNRLVNAIKAAGDLLNRLPRDELSPETTAGREGFLHPYSIEGGVGLVKLNVLLRDFDSFRLTEYAQRLRQEARAVEDQFPGVQLEVHVTPQYRNLAEGLRREPRAVSLAEQAFEQLGLPRTRSIIRGGTDGSRLTELGLPTPNLSSGQHAPHSPLEWACLDEMVQATQVLVQLARLWGQVE